MFAYLRDKYDVDIVLNEDFARYNNTSSLIRVIDKLDNTFVCSSDNYFPENVFMNDSDDSYYSALYAEGETNEYCLTTDADDYITDVRVGGRVGLGYRDTAQDAITIPHSNPEKCKQRIVELLRGLTTMGYGFHFHPEWCEA